jgi:superfamily II DNA or RNA helicase
MSTTSSSAGLADLELEVGYDSSDRALREFYVPCLSRAVRYDRSVGYFRASALSVAARGLSRFITHGGTVRLLVGAEVAEDDVEALTGALEIPAAIAARLADGLATADDIAARRLEVLAWLVREGRLEVRVAVAVDDHGRPVPTGAGVPYFHEKIGVLRDKRGDGVAFQGSVNESATAWTKNFESFSVYTSWGASAPYFDHWVQKFEARWHDKVPGFRIFPLPVAAEQRLLSYAPDYEPSVRDPEEPATPPDQGLLARVLRAAPRAVGAEDVAEATTGVQLFPHQRQVVERLAGQFPRSWLVADEVGLGKTISGGMALRRLLLSGQVRRALILAPANVCRQWQDELFEKFGLWVPRLDGGKLHGAHPDDVRLVAAGENPYESAPVLIASSHTARRAQHQALVEAAAPFDLLIVDEAHHARRQGFADLAEYRPSRLLRLLDGLADRDLLRTVWLLTATPMQVHPIELRDLLRHVGLDGPLAAWSSFSRYYAQLAQPDEDTNWGWLAWALSASPAPEFDAADLAVLADIERRLGPVQTTRVRTFHEQVDADAVARELGAAGRRELRAWLRHRGPVMRSVTRHSRATLKEYQRRGLLTEPLADRDVQAVPIELTPSEQELYDRLDELIDRLMSTHADRRGAGFVLTVYRRRLTSSWAAIRKTLRRRLDRERALVYGDESDDVLDEDLDADEEQLDDFEAVPLSNEDLYEIDRYLREIDDVPDSKFDRLRHDLDDARGEGRSMIVFTQFADTLHDLRDRLHAAYQSQLATYTGEGGRMWRPEEGWIACSKQELVDAVRSGRITVLLATDAASEGINLQACSSLINYDLPWNPMRVEQRIGRIDRIGQTRPIVTVRNYVIPGTVEESVYAALADRIDDFSELLGNLQPILGQTERAFQRIFRAPRSERASRIREELRSIDEQIGELRESGIDLSDEDPLPLPRRGGALVDLESLTRAVGDDLGLQLGEPGHPVTAAPQRASRDPGTFAALLTYGHPELAQALTRLVEAAVAEPGEPVVIAEDEAGVCAIVRADRSPAVPLRGISDLYDVGDAYAAGEARTLADRLVAEETTRRRHAIAGWYGRSLDRWRKHVEARFIELVRREIGIDQLLAERDSPPRPDAVLVWHALAQDHTTGWAYAETFRSLLAVDIADLLPEQPVDVDTNASSRELSRRRIELARELLELMTQWRERQAA